MYLFKWENILNNIFISKKSNHDEFLFLFFYINYYNKILN